MLTHVISGGQTGVDIAALRAAKSVGLRTGGAMPKGFRTESGPRPKYADLYGCYELASDDYAVRTRRNAAAGDMTLLIGTDLDSPGSRTTRRCAQSAGRPVHLLPWPSKARARVSASVREELVRILGEASAASLEWTLNVAGNRDRALEGPVEAFLTGVFAEVIQAQRGTPDTE